MARLKPLCSLILGLIAVALAPPGAVSGELSLIGWTLSDSPTDPLAVIGPAAADTVDLYLWLYCAEAVTGGVLSSNFFLDVDPRLIEVLEFVPEPGVTDSEEFLYVFDLTLEGCPRGSFLAGRLRVAFHEPAYCIRMGPGEPTGPASSYGCADPETPVGVAFLGYTTLIPEWCSNDPNFFLWDFCIPPVSTDPFSWGRIKARYRN